MGFFDLFKKKEKCSCCECGATEYAHSAVVYINGMSCNHCSKSVEDAFGALSETSAKVDLEKKCAHVNSNNELTEEILKETVEKTGFEFVKAEIER